MLIPSKSPKMMVAAGFLALSYLFANAATNDHQPKRTQASHTIERADHKGIKQKKRSDRHQRNFAKVKKTKLQALSRSLDRIQRRKACIEKATSMKEIRTCERTYPLRKVSKKRAALHHKKKHEKKMKKSSTTKKD